MKLNISSSQDDIMNRILLLYSALNNVTITPFERSIYSLFVSLPPKFNNQRFSSVARTKVLQEYVQRYRPISRSSLNNTINDLKRKNLIVQDEDKVLYIHPQMLSLYHKFVKDSKLTITFEIFDPLSRSSPTHSSSDSSDN